MKAIFLARRFVFWPAVFAVCFAGVFRLQAAVSLNINPPAITNDFVGKIVLSISGLTAGQTVRLDAYVDLNGNSTLDPGEPLVLSFPVSDGQVPLVAGVRNLNVPGDEDGLTNGQIRVELSIPSIGGGTVGGTKSIVVISDPAGGFSPVTQLFTVVQRIYPQAVTGRITAAASGLPLTNTLIGLVGINDRPTPLSQTDANGYYTIYILPGIYIAGVLNSPGGFVFSGLRFALVGCGQFVTNNLALQAGTFYLAGKVVDSATGQGIAGIAVDANSTSNLGVLTATDTNGNYSVFVTPGTWSIHPSSDGASQLGYLPVARTNVPITSASISNVNFSLTRATSLIYGTVKDQQNNPIAGVLMSARDPANLYHPVSRTTASTGQYALGVQAGLWTFGPDSGSLASRGLSGLETSVQINTTLATNVNFVVTRTTLPSLAQPVRLSSTQFAFMLNGFAGQNYQLEATAELGSAGWLEFLTTNTPCDSIVIVDPSATNSARYYRARLLP